MLPIRIRDYSWNFTHDFYENISSRIKVTYFYTITSTSTKSIETRRGRAKRPNSSGYIHKTHTSNLKDQGIRVDPEDQVIYIIITITRPTRIKGDVQCTLYTV